MNTLKSINYKLSIPIIIKYCFLFFKIFIIDMDLSADPKELVNESESEKEKHFYMNKEMEVYKLLTLLM